jgi:hypothetical protein
MNTKDPCGATFSLARHGRRPKRDAEIVKCRSSADAGIILKKE